MFEAKQQRPSKMEFDSNSEGDPVSRDESKIVNPSQEISSALGYNERDEFQRMRALCVELVLSNHQKRIVMGRVVEQLRTYTAKYKTISILYHTLNGLNTIGLTAMPALLTLSSTDSDYHQPIFWASFAISVSTGITAAMLAFFQTNRKYFLYNKLCEGIKRHFYSFCALSERYEACGSHKRAFSTFIHEVESLIAKTLAKAYDGGKNKTPPSSRSVSTPMPAK